jgi:hypothetical protein
VEDLDAAERLPDVTRTQERVHAGSLVALRVCYLQAFG